MIDEDPRLFAAEIILNLMLSYRDIQVCPLCAVSIQLYMYYIYVM